MSSGLVLSASQASLKRRCDRKYAFSYVCGYREPPTPAQALGTEVDDTQLQPYLRDGKTFDYTRDSGYIAAAGLAYLPEPGTPGLEVQKHFVLPSPTGQFSWQGYLDLWLPQRGMPGLDTELQEVSSEEWVEVPVPTEHNGITIPIVSDFKTTTNLKWAKTESQLAEDVQAMLYATWAMWKTKARVVDLAWIYFQTRGARKATRTHIRVDGDHVGYQFLEIDKTGQEIVALRRAAPNTKDTKELEAYALSLEPNIDACEDYGGCPHRFRCNLSPAQFVDSIIPANRRLPVVSNTLDLFANLAMRQQQAATMTPAEVLASVAPAPAMTTPAQGLASVAPSAQQLPGVVGINPPEQALPPAPPVGAVEAKPAAKKGGRKKTTTEAAPVDDNPHSSAGKTGETQASAAPISPPPSAAGSAFDPAAFDAAWVRVGEQIKALMRVLGGK